MQSGEQKYPSFRQNAKHYFFEFCERTSIHGFNFLGEYKRTVWERAWWLIIISIAVYFSIAMIYQSFEKWKNSPVIVTFATEYTPIWQIPFPAITICPEIKSVKEYYNYSDYLYKKIADDDLTPDEIAHFEYMSLACDAPEEVLNKSYTTVDTEALEFLYQVQPSFSDSVFQTTWSGGKDHSEQVSEFFSPIITSEGICYTFNIMDRSDVFTDIAFGFKDTYSSNGKKSVWSLENGYAQDSDINSYPRRTMISGASGGLTLMIHVMQEDIDYACSDIFQGFKVALHPPDQVPRVKQKYFRLPLDYSVVVGIKPNMMTTSASLKTYDAAIRKCYFNEDKQLKFFKVYNQGNCMLECQTNFTVAHCGCASMHSPRLNSTPICGAAIKPCVEEAKTMFTNNQEDPKTKCDCLPSCTTLEYDAQISQSRWNWRSFMHVEKNTKKWRSQNDYLLSNEAHFSQLIVYYKDMQFMTSERNELYTAADFLANCGGLLGLFTGFTFICAFDVIYYLTLRLFFNVRMFGWRYWSGSEKLLKKKK